ncbi:cation efflux protein [Dendrothele bispora CBS 962.96]|uniref:Cation efflux protein n=1 Tax=Dendrothele bispora (strain CBS 962.96) TaxID=1314807 RepID=A0A4S8MQ08_DENBC|nr:cation efflux protein [Dendrothele bispora CBS 962.96]
MAISRATRISILLAIDVVFFFVELIVGYAVGSLALVADSFHMLNDVMSLIVALYAIKLTSGNATDSRYSYGWHRAEILAALINGVFLLALCFSIFLEALERFFSTPEISNPRLVVVVGSLGLASNIVGLFLFHEHGHSHSHGHTHSHGQEVPSPVLESGEATPTQKIPVRRSRSPTQSLSHSGSYSSLYGHPAATRAHLVQTAQDLASARSPSPSARRNSHSRPNLSSENSLETDSAPEVREPEVDSSNHDSYQPSENTPLLNGDLDRQQPFNGHSHSHGHSHSGSMNMHAILLHVLGDALGNVGVIATGLVIWFSSWSFKYYFDPVISLVITAIIFSSALPLVRSASFILLQAVPPNVSLEDVRSSILKVDGVLSLHELHVWQLSETKIVASVHVLASRKHDFMRVAATIRLVLHHHGIHSSTIQPEYAGMTRPEEQLETCEETPCLIVCPPDRECDPRENACCPPRSTEV